MVYNYSVRFCPYLLLLCIEFVFIWLLTVCFFFFFKWLNVILLQRHCI
uniref:Uncharacterized protein n=1 Tax=Rhizophora mucronata TaxID=61149 RepID=A0A2P2PWA5_RHIMU